MYISVGCRMPNSGFTEKDAALMNEIDLFFDEIDLRPVIKSVEKTSKSEIGFWITRESNENDKIEVLILVKCTIEGRIHHYEAKSDVLSVQEVKTNFKKLSKALQIMKESVCSHGWYYIQQYFLKYFQSVN